MKRLFVSFFFALATLLSVVAQSDLQVIAEVNLTKKEPITLGQLKNFVNEMEKTSGKKSTPAQRKEILDALVNQKLILQLAKKEGVRISDSQVNDYFNNMLSQMTGRRITESEFANVLKQETGMSFDNFMKKQNGLTVSEYKDFIRENLTTQTYVLQKNRKQIESAVPTDAEIRKAFSNNKHNFVRPAAASLFIVAVQKKGNTDAEKALVNKVHDRLVADPTKTNAVLQEAQSGKSGFFAVSISVYNTEQSATQVGITMAQLAEVFDSPVNTVSTVVEMADNFQFFVVKAKSEAKLMELKDKIDPNQDMTVYQLVKNQLTMQHQQQAIQEATSQILSNVKVSKHYKILKSDAELLKLFAW